MHRTGLRFKVIRPTETLEEFKLRINAHSREDDYDEDHAGETGTWELGAGWADKWFNSLQHMARNGSCPFPSGPHSRTSDVGLVANADEREALRPKGALFVDCFHLDTS